MIVFFTPIKAERHEGEIRHFILEVDGLSPAKLFIADENGDRKLLQDHLGVYEETKLRL